MRTSRVLYTVAVTTVFFCFVAISAAGQSRFSGVIESGAGLFLGEKSGEVLEENLVLGFKTKERFFLGLGVGFERRFLLNSEYNPNPIYPPFDWDFTKPRILKGNDVSLFLNARYYMGEGRFKPTFDSRAGLAMGFSSTTLGGVFASVGAGYRYDLTQRTGISLRAFYEIKGGFMADDVYESMEGWFNSVGLRLSYEF